MVQPLWKRAWQFFTVLDTETHVTRQCHSQVPKRAKDISSHNVSGRVVHNSQRMKITHMS